MKSKRRMFTKTSAIAHRFDNNEYSEDSKHFDKTNKKVMENLDTRGIPITEFILLRSKMYSYMKDNDKTAKGIKKNVISKNIAYVNYKITLFNNE